MIQFRFGRGVRQTIYHGEHGIVEISGLYSGHSARVTLTRRFANESESFERDTLRLFSVYSVSSVVSVQAHDAALLPELH